MNQSVPESTDGGVSISRMTTNTYSFLKSRTFYTIVIMFLVGGVHGITSFLPSGAETIIMAVLGVVATYFHVDGVNTAGQA